MAYTIAGITIPLTACNQRMQRFGDTTFAYSGRILKQQRAQARVWECETGFMTVAEAERWRALIEGEGHHFSSTDLYADTGMSFLDGHSMTAGNTAGTTKFGSYMLAGVNGGTVSTGFASDMTVAYWLYADSRWWLNGDSNWHHIVHTKSLSGVVTKYDNGVVTTAALPTSIDGGDVTITGSTTLFDSATDDLVILGLLAPQSWAVAWAAATVQFSPLPYIYVGGDFGANTVLGEVTRLEYSTKVLGGTAQTAVKLSFFLTEVL
jgi:hypothetical protein